MARRNNYRQLVMLALLLVLTSLPVFVFAQTSEPNSANLVPCGQTVIEGGKPIIKNPCGYQHFLQLMVNVFVYLTKYIAVPLAAGVIVIGGAIMMTAGTNDSKRAQAKKIIWMAVWGLVIVLASYLIVKLVFTTLVKTKYIPPNFK